MFNSFAAIYSVLPQVAHRDLFIVISLVLVIALAITKVIFPLLFVESFSLSRLFGFRVKEDLGSNIRPFSTEHIFFTALYSFILAFVALFMINQMADSGPDLSILLVDSFGQGFLLWLILGIVINLIVYLKYLLIAVIGWLFHARALVNKHFIDYVNASSLFYLLVSIVLSLTIYSTFIVGKTFSQIVISIIFIFLFYRSFLMYIKLLQLSPYSKLYIFSYICTTELIPVLIALKFLTT